MNGLKIPKEAARVLLSVPPSPPAERIMFLSSFAERHRGQETVSEVLARPESFMPVVEEGLGTHLLRKGAIQWVSVFEPRRIEWLYYEEREGAPRKSIRIAFSDGQPLEGDIYAMTPEGEQRVSDVVNKQAGFLPLECGEDLYLVNLSHAVDIRNVEEQSAGA